MKRNLTIGTRRSQLALWQANYVAEALRRHDPELTVQLQHIVTQGDKILDVPLARIGGKGLSRQNWNNASWTAPSTWPSTV